MSEIGSISILLSFFISIYSLVFSIIGVKKRNRSFVKSAENGLIAIFLLLLFAGGSLIYELITLNFSIKYVALNTSTDLPTIYRISSLWAGQAGSLLLWSIILSGFTAIVVFQNRNKDRDFQPYVNATLAVISLFFLYLITYVENPFERLDFTPNEGRGLNPILQNGYMAIHPLTLYIGYVGLSVPFAFGMAALISGKLDDNWIRNSRKWALFAWTFLSIGLLLGARWAYLELGWGGYWAWDPVENAAFMPWLAGTAFLHSIMIQERKGMFKKWNIVLLIITFFLTIFGTFLTRSGIVSSVHSFAQSDIGPLFLGFIAFILLFSFAIFTYRLKDLESGEKFDSMLSRESAFVFNNLLFLAAAFTVFLGTIFPILSEAVTGNKILVGPPYFNKVNVPIGLILILLMGVGPLISWRKASPNNLKKNFLIPAIFGVLTGILFVALGMREVVAIITFSICAFVTSTIFIEFFRGVKVRSRRGENYLLAFSNLVSRNRRRYGGYIIHLGVVLIVIGITSSSVFLTQKEVVMAKGDSFDLGRYTLRFEGVRTFSNDAKDGTVATLAVFDGDKKLTNMTPEKNIYKYEGNREINQETEVALRSTLRDDLYLILSNSTDDGRASIRALLNPMVSWIWAGGIFVVLGALVAMWPGVRFARFHSLVPEIIGSRRKTT